MAHICGTHFQNKYLVVFLFMVISLSRGQGWGRQEAFFTFLTGVAVSSLLDRMLGGGCFLEWLYRLYSWKEKYWYLRGNYHHLPRLKRQQRQESHNQSRMERRMESALTGQWHHPGLATLPVPEASWREIFNSSLMIHLWKCDPFKFLVPTTGIVETVM